MSDPSTQSSEAAPSKGPALWVYALVAVLSIAAGFGLRKLVDPAPRGDASAAGPVIEFELPTLDGEVTRAEDFRGRVLVVDFWATWCQPCRVQSEILHQLTERYSSSQVAFLAIDVQEPRDLVEQFVAESPFPYPVALDEDGELSPRYGVYGLPTVLVAGGDGRIAFLNVGISSEETLRRVIDDLLAQS